MRAIAVDGGQSAIRAVMIPEGVTATGPGIIHSANGVEVTLGRALRIVIAEMSVAAGGGTGSRLRMDRVVVASSGMPHDPDARSVIAGAIREVIDVPEVLLSGDEVSSFLGAMPGAGVVAALGTGAAVTGLGPDGRVRVVDGHGYILGDDGSAFQLGSWGLRAVLRDADGREPAPALRRLAEARYGDVSGIDQLVYRSPAPVDLVARFAVDVLAAAADGDPIASRVLVDATAGLADSIHAAAQGFLDEDTVPVAVVGGLARAKEQILPHISSRLAALGRRAEFIDPVGTPLDGARLIAIEGTNGAAAPFTELITTEQGEA